HNDKKRIGALEENKVIDLNAAFFKQLKTNGEARAAQITEAYIPTDMVGFIEGGKESLKYAKEAVEFALNSNDQAEYVFDVNDVRLEAPVQQPKKIICVGHNYREHILEMGRELPPHPLVFAKFANAIIGPEDDIPFYPISEQ